MEEKVENTVSNRLNYIEKDVKNSFKTICEEFEDHLDAINENTEELNDHSAALGELDGKIEKLNERIDELFMMMKQLVKPHFSLSDAEKKVFMVIYSVENTPVSYSDIARKADMTELAVKAHIYALINKGVPIIARRIDRNPYFKLEKSFKDRQAKENFIQIEEAIVKQVC